MHSKIKSIKLNISNLLLNKAFLLYCMSYSTYGYINETSITILSSKIPFTIFPFNCYF